LNVDDGDALPIDDIADSFTKKLAGEHPVVVVAPTGSGKSTRLPIWMADTLARPVLVVEPRRVVCRSLAVYLAAKQGENVGDDIGYRVRFDDCSSTRTRILFVTPGVALRMLSSGDETAFAGIMIDEFHERSWETDLLLTVLLHRDQRAGLVLTSATIDADQVAKAVDGSVIHAEGRAFPVDLEYCAEPPLPVPENLDVRIAQTIKQIVTNTTDDGGDVLVFVPGKRQIDEARERLQPLCREHRMVCVPVHGGLPTRNVADALSKRTGQRRIFLATNIAETSLTIPGVTIVIDSGLARQRVHRGGHSALAVAPVSEAAMEQRRGRAGRVSAGRCVRLWHNTFKPASVTAPEVTRIELTDLMLRAANCGLEGDAFTNAAWPTPLPDFAIHHARTQLIQMRALTDTGTITDFGGALLKLPVGVAEARALVDTPEPLKGATADLVALLNTRGELFLRHSDSDTEDARRELCGQTNDEVYAHLLALRRGHVRKHGLHASRLQEARRISTALRQLLKAQSTSPDKDQSDLPTVAEFATFLLSRWPETAFVLRPRAMATGKRAPKPGSALPWSNDAVEVNIHSWRPPWPVDDEQRRQPKAGLVLEQEWLGQAGTRTVGIGRMLLPCKYELLAAAGLGNCELRNSTPTGKRGKIRIAGVVERTYGGVVLSTEEQELTGEPLHQAAATLIIENRLMKGVAELIADDLHLLRILVATGEVADTSGDVDIATWMTSRLAELGVESASDLELLDAGDMRPNLSDVAMHVDLARVRKDFPRRWEHQGAVYHCAVDIRRREVVLQPINGQAKKAPDPSVTVLPRFRSFRVRHQKASRITTIRD
jgi:ATP-dependent helicase HrpB